MSPREREQPQGLQANALQDRPNAFDQANAQVVMQRQRQEVRQQEMPGGVFLQQNNVLQQVIQAFEQSPQLNMLLENHQDVIQQLVHEAHRVRGEIRDMKTAVGRALAMVDQNQSGHANAIQELREVLAQHAAEIANARHFENELQARIQETQAQNQHLNTSVLACERQLAYHKAQLGVLETLISNKLNDSIVKLPENHQILHQEVQTLREDMKRGFDEIYSQSSGPDETTKLRINQLEPNETHF